jgi:hypothetical protein
MRKATSVDGLFHSGTPSRLAYPLFTIQCHISSGVEYHARVRSRPRISTPATAFCYYSGSGIIL